MSASVNPDIVTDGLVLCLDAGNSDSYPGTGTRWYDLSGQNAHCDSVGSPTFTNSGASSYWQFTDTQRFNSIDLSQNYKDLFIIFRLEDTGIRMIFSQYDGLDKSLRFVSGNTRSSTDANDWENNELSKTFVNGNFNSGGVNIYNQWKIIRTYRSNTGFGTSFRYQISSSWNSSVRGYIGKINYIACYNRELNNTEVLQNYKALKGRYGL
jgi:hypothetical protein